MQRKQKREEKKKKNQVLFTSSSDGGVRGLLASAKIPRFPSPSVTVRPVGFIPSNLSICSPQRLAKYPHVISFPRILIGGSCSYSIQFRLLSVSELRIGSLTGRSTIAEI